MQLIIENGSSNTLSYLGGLVTVSANANFTVPLQYLYPCARDPQLIADCNGGVVNLNDGVNDYSGKLAIDFLNELALSLGGAVVGYAGANAPSFQITVGGKDSNGKSQPARMNQFGDLSTNFRNTYSNLTGNSTTTVKSAAGTLHGILINNNSTDGSITVYDSLAASGTKIATLKIGSPSGGLLSSSGVPSSQFLGPLGIEFTTGMTVVLSGSASNDVTMVYQ